MNLNYWLLLKVNKKIKQFTSNGYMKKNSKKNNNYFANVETSQKTKKKIKINNGLLKTNQIPIAGIHSIFSALNNKNRKFHYLITTNTNLSKWN